MTTPATDPRLAAVVVAAGRGSRYGAPKHGLVIEGLELWQRCVDVLRAAGVGQIVVVGDVPGGIAGGERRRDSVANGLADISDAEWVLVHDAARPLVTIEVISRVVERLRQGDVDGVVPAVQVADTVKRVRDGMVVETVDRRGLVTVQTPQGFRRDALQAAHQSLPGVDATDDAGLVEANGGTIATVEGDVDNFKVTYPDDLNRAVRIAAGRAAT